VANVTNPTAGHCAGFTMEKKKKKRDFSSFQDMQQCILLFSEVVVGSMMLCVTVQLGRRRVMSSTFSFLDRLVRHTISKSFLKGHLERKFPSVRLFRMLWSIMLLRRTDKDSELIGYTSKVK
jgi:hypothetical protein